MILHEMEEYQEEEVQRAVQLLNPNNVFNHEKWNRLNLFFLDWMAALGNPRAKKLIQDLSIKHQIEFAAYDSQAYKVLEILRRWGNTKAEEALKHLPKPSDSGNGNGQLHAFAASGILGLDLLLNGQSTQGGMLLTGLAILASSSFVAMAAGNGKKNNNGSPESMAEPEIEFWPGIKSSEAKRLRNLIQTLRENPQKNTSFENLVEIVNQKFSKDSWKVMLDLAREGHPQAAQYFEHYARFPKVATALAQEIRQMAQGPVHSDSPKALITALWIAYLHLGSLENEEVAQTLRKLLAEFKNGSKTKTTIGPL